MFSFLGNLEAVADPLPQHLLFVWLEELPFALLLTLHDTINKQQDMAFVGMCSIQQQ